jgi:hypothetical protein
MRKSKRGFASMDPELRRKIASLGGKATQASGNGHRWDKGEAKIAGSLGGKATQNRGSGHRFDSETGRAAAKARERKRRGR